MPTHVAVIGAGVAGCACARALQDSGLRVTVFEKSRGVGGRLATRRPFGLEDPLGIDHGAPIALPTAGDPNSLAQLRRLGAPFHDGAQDGVVGRAGMSDLARRLAAPEGGETLRIEFETEIAEVARGDDDWLLRSTDGASHGPFDAVVAAAPAAQTRALLGDACPSSETEASYAPVMSVLAVFDPAPLDDLGPATLISPVAPLKRVDRMGGRPGRALGGREAWVGHADQDWSEQHKNTDREEIAAALIGPLKRAIGVTAEPTYVAGHRWLYAIVNQPVGRAYWLSAPTAAGPGPIGCCGDWRLGPHVGDAFRSGDLLAKALIDRIS
ncbi:MAG: FAD-dependent oxidoreductase [Pseudomonadota bacterium]